MKINPVSNDPVQLYKSTRLTRQEPLSDWKSSKDKVVLTKEAVSFSKIMSNTNFIIDEDSSPQRQSKINDIASKIKSGQYHMPSLDVAEKIIMTAMGREGFCED